MAGTSKQDGQSDEVLVDACNHGTATAATQAFTALYTRHKDYVIRVALRFVPDNDAALDVLQETFTYLLRKFPPTGPGLTLSARLPSLLYIVAKNSAITLLRKAQRFPDNGTVQPDELPSPEASETGGIASLLEELTDERREVLMLRFVDDLPLQDIAFALDIPLGTVKSRLHLALRQLRDNAEAKNLSDP
jgi:RNA polymerase sigma-70 factor (ECF subfamily)